MLKRVKEQQEKEKKEKEKKEKEKEKPKGPTPLEKLDKALEKVAIIVKLSKQHKFSKPVVAASLLVSLIVFLLIVFVWKID
jgi:predicted histidine transporter YuiF (NhaC family)